MSGPITVTPPANTVTIMVGDEPFMIHVDMSDSTTMRATRVQRAIALGLLQAAIEVMGREPNPLLMASSEVTS